MSGCLAALVTVTALVAIATAPESSSTCTPIVRGPRDGNVVETSELPSESSS